MPESTQRYREIMSAFTRHGLRHLLSGGSVKPRPGERWTNQLVSLLEDLGPTFIKVGQVLSTRPDLVPPDLAKEMERLQEGVYPCPFAVIKNSIEDSLGRSIEDVFVWIDESPLASASIAQVHKARLPSGQEVAVKVRRPGINKRLTEDMVILRSLAQRCEAHTPWGRRYRVTDLVEEVAQTLEDEMDFRREAQNLERFGRCFDGEPSILVPGVYHELTSEDVLTMDYLHGISLRDPSTLALHGIKPDRLAQTVIRAMALSIFHHGLFHADPHPGNLSAVEPDRVIFVDLGMMGELSEDTRRNLTDLLRHIGLGNESGVTEALIHLMPPETGDVPKTLRRDVKTLMERYPGARLGDIKLGSVIRECLDVAKGNRLRIPRELALVAKSVVTAEGVVRRLDPDIRLTDIMSMGVILSPGVNLMAALHSVLEIGGAALRLPQRVTVFMENLQHEGLDLNLNYNDAQGVIPRLQAVLTAFVFSLVILSFSIVLAGISISLGLLGVGEGLMKAVLGLGVFALVLIGVSLIWLLRSLAASIRRKRGNGR